MSIKKIFFTAVVAFCLGLTGCSSHGPAATKNDAQQMAVNMIAVLPVQNNAADARVSKMLRTKLSDELRFKGYPQVDLDLIDRKLAPLTGTGELKSHDVIPPKRIEELLGADAALYCSLMESKTSKKFFYAPVTVSVRCELLSTKTGETIWGAQHKATSRSFDVSGKRLEMKALGDLETVTEEVVGKILETLPYGPKLRS